MHFTGALFQENGVLLQDLNSTTTFQAPLPSNHPSSVIFYDQPFFKGNVVLQLDMNYNETFNSFNGTLKNVKSIRAGIHYIELSNPYHNDCNMIEANDIVYLPMICSSHNIIEKVALCYDDLCKMYLKEKKTSIINTLSTTNACI